MEETEYRYDTQMLIEGTDLDEDEIHDYLMNEIPGDCLIVVGDELQLATDPLRVARPPNLGGQILIATI